MDNDGVSEDFVDIDAIHHELKARCESRIGGPWVLREDFSDLDQRNSASKSLKPKVGLPYIPSQSQV